MPQPLVSWGVVRDVFDSYCRRRHIGGDERFDVDFYDFYGYIIRPRNRPPPGVGAKRVRAWKATLQVLQTKPGRLALEQCWDHIVVEDDGTEPSRTSPATLKLAVVLGWGEGKTTTLQVERRFAPGAEVGSARLASAFLGLSRVAHRALRSTPIPEFRRVGGYSGEPRVFDRAGGTLAQMLQQSELPNDERLCLLEVFHRGRKLYADESETSGWR